MTISAPGSIYFGPGWSGLSEGMLLRRPIRILRADHLEDVLLRLQEAAQEASAGRLVAGYVAYEAGAAFEAAVPVRASGRPLLWMGVYERIDVLHDLGATACEVIDARFSLSRAQHAEGVDTIRRLIREGDVYQINFTGHVDFRLRGGGAGLFSDLLERQYVPYAAYLNTGDEEILSLSPELFFERRGDRILTRPMKGTVRRGSTGEEDRQLEAWLSDDEKSRAENLMIVDLLRNDLSRVCLPGSVRVPSLFSTERYETLIQMTSEVEGRLRPGVETPDLFRALFPCGSVTGAPKIRSMQRIHEIETSPRGVYCGAVGFMQGETAVFNVAIRTAVLQAGDGRLGVGSGIVWDSDPDAEYEECLLKARFLTGPRDFKLIETMRWEDGRIDLLDLHLERLKRSAFYFGFAFSRAEIRRRVEEAAHGLTGGRRKVRLTLSSKGEIDVVVSRFEPAKNPLHVTLSTVPIDASDVFRRHKTTRRALYESEFAAASEEGFDEVIFLNDRGELAEGSRTNIIVVKDGIWFTPPVESGALPGVFREHLIRTRADLRERVLYIADLVGASDIYLCNAVVGLARARMVSEPVHTTGR